MHNRALVILMIALVASMLACDEKKRPLAQSPAPTPAATQPVLDHYKELWEQLDYSKLVLTAYVYPARAGLEFDESIAAGGKEQLVSFLSESQPQIARLIELSRKQPETFPPPIEPGPSGDAHMRHPAAWTQNFGRLLHADAGRCWDAGDATGAAERTAALIRLGQSQRSQPENFDRMRAQGLSGLGIVKAVALCRAGLLDSASPEALNELRSAADSVQLAEDAPELSATIRPKLDELRTLLSERR